MKRTTRDIPGALTVSAYWRLEGVTGGFSASHTRAHTQAYARARARAHARSLSGVLARKTALRSVSKVVVFGAFFTVLNFLSSGSVSLGFVRRPLVWRWSILVDPVQAVGASPIGVYLVPIVSVAWLFSEIFRRR